MLREPSPVRARMVAIRLHLAPVLALSLVAAALAAPSSARPCSVCGCGDPLLTSSDPAAMAGQLRLQIDTEYLRMRAANEDDPAAHDVLTQWTYRLNAAYRPADRLTLSATLPMVSKDLRTSGGSLAPFSSNATALGDVEASARLSLWRTVAIGQGRVHELAISGGTSMPTGANDVRSGGERIDEHGQPGTGSWGPFVGMHYRFEQRDLTAFASLSGRIRTRNAHDYTYGSAVLWSVHGEYFVRRWLVADLGVDGRYAAADRSGAETVPNTGGTVLAFAPGVYAKAIGNAWIFLRGQIPFVQALRGDQRQYPSVVAGLQYEIL